MGLSTGDGFRFNNGGFLSRAFIAALKLNALVAVGRAGWQEFEEHNRAVPLDGRNIVVDASIKFVYENPKDAAVFIYEQATAPE